jgi:hypothetical protein
MFLSVFMRSSFLALFIISFFLFVFLPLVVSFFTLLFLSALIVLSSRLPCACDFFLSSLFLYLFIYGCCQFVLSLCLPFCLSPRLSFSLVVFICQVWHVVLFVRLLSSLTDSFVHFIVDSVVCASFCIYFCPSFLAFALVSLRVVNYFHGSLLLAFFMSHCCSFFMHSSIYFARTFVLSFVMCVAPSVCLHFCTLYLCLSSFMQVFLSFAFVFCLLIYFVNYFFLVFFRSSALQSDRGVIPNCGDRSL